MVATTSLERLLLDVSELSIVWSDCCNVSKVLALALLVQLFEPVAGLDGGFDPVAAVTVNGMGVVGPDGVKTTAV